LGAKVRNFVESKIPEPSFHNICTKCFEKSENSLICPDFDCIFAFKIHSSTRQVHFWFMNKTAEKYLKNLRNPWMMRLFFLSKLPSAFFWGFRVRSITPERSEISIPYGWRTQNPFQSIYFAAQSGAAELSTGILGLLALAGQPPTSMLIVKVESEFTKKANGLVVFTCQQGAEVQAVIQQALATGESQTIRMETIGVQQNNGEVVAKMYFTWSFKKKKSV
jgi:hypothetical protein